MARTLSAGEVAVAVGVRPVTVRKWAAGGRIPSDRTVGGHRRFSLDEVLAAVRPSDALLQDVVATLRHEIGRWTVQPLHVSVFGSVARGTASEASDVDVLVVVPAFRSVRERRAFGEQMVRLHFAVDREVHRDLREVELDLARLERVVSSTSSFLVDVLREGREVWGAPLRDLLQPMVGRVTETTAPGAA